MYNRELRASEITTLSMANAPMSISKKFKVIIPGVSRYTSLNHILKASVYSSSIDYHHLRLMTAQVRGIERKLFRRSLHKTKPMEFEDRQMRLIDPAKKCRGNAGDYKSDTIIRKIRSEQLALNDCHTDDLLDMIEAQRDHPEYIQCAGSPFFVYIASKEQLELLLREMKSNPKQPLHLDATGSLIRRPSGSSDVIYYYAGVIQLKSHRRVVPVFKMVSSSHYGGSIGQWLGHF